MAKKRERLTEALRYVLKADRGLPKDQQTTFVLEAIRSPERMRIWDEINVVTKDKDGVADITSRSFQQARELVLKHLISVENFPVGDPKPWPKGVELREEYLEDFDDLDVWEVGNELRERSSVGKTPDPVEPAPGMSPEPTTSVEEEARHAGNS